MKKVLVTGGTGFLGQKLALKLHSLGQDVTVLGRNLIIGDRLQQLGLKFLSVDITNSDKILSAISEQEDVFHCAALSSPWGREADFYLTNVLGTRNIIQSCLTHRVRRLIYVSTSAVYFNLSHRFNIKETDNLAPYPIHPYIKTKQLAEQEINRGFQNGLPVVSIRPRGIFGPGDTVIFPRLLKVSETTGIPLINGGKAIIDMTYIDNVVDGLLLCQTAPDQVLGEYFNISNGEPIELFNLLQRLSEKLNISLNFKPLPYPIAYTLSTAMEWIYKYLLTEQEPPLTRYTLGLLAFSQTLDITSAKIKLGYEPLISMEQGLDEFVRCGKF
ncbi:MAG: NAD-dependent epimerase/dehydratase family protein [Planktothrix sp. GU0601_MAG3]|nr:MAG: NAD-dependent epimerase/dehydratase family protein [Planktothrix sp. GU0601_MAG3]